MKKSEIIKLVLISSALASCHKPGKLEDKDKEVYMRSDSTASFDKVTTYEHHGHSSPIIMWYYAFRPYGMYGSGYDLSYMPGIDINSPAGYHRAGYYSSALSEGSNIGSSASKSSIVRGGFGSHGFAVSS